MAAEAGLSCGNVFAMRLVVRLLSCGLFISAVHAQPLVDHHQHLLQSARGVPEGFALTASDLIAQLDLAKIRRAAVLSIAYQMGNPYRPPVENEYERVKAENDWTRDQAALYPTRLRAICGVNPLKDYALTEIARCAAALGLRSGLKLHFGNSDVDLDNPTHLAKMEAVFREANRHRMAIIGHIRANVDHDRPWGAKQARVFLERLLPQAPDVPVQIAHMASAGRFDQASDEALMVFVNALAAKDKRVKRLFFDISVDWGSNPDLLVERIRAIGLDRILFASDGPPAPALAKFRTLPLTKSEFRKIEHNVAPYMK